MDIDGLSIRTLMRFINEGYISDFADIYNISAYKDQIIELDGFGEKSFANMIASVDKARKRHPANFIYALCIPMIGLDAAKRLIAFYGTNGFFEKIKESNLSSDIFAEVDGIGIERSTAIVKWISTHGINDAIAYIYPALSAYLEKYKKILRDYRITINIL